MTNKDKVQFVGASLVVASLVMVFVIWIAGHHSANKPVVTVTVATPVASTPARPVPTSAPKPAKQLTSRQQVLAYVHNFNKINPTTPIVNVLACSKVKAGFGCLVIVQHNNQHICGYEHFTITNAQITRLRDSGPRNAKFCNQVAQALKK